MFRPFGQRRELSSDGLSVLLRELSFLARCGAKPWRLEGKWIGRVSSDGPVSRTLGAVALIVIFDCSSQGLLEGKICPTRSSTSAAVQEKVSGVKGVRCQVDLFGRSDGLG